MKKLFICLAVLIVAGQAVMPQALTIEEKKEFPRKGMVLDARFSPFRNWFAVTRRDNSLEIYDRNWDQVFIHRGNPASYSGIIAFSPDERYLAYGRYKGNNDIAIIRLSDMKVVQTLRGHSYSISDLAFSNDCNLLASVSRDQSMVIWKSNGGVFTLEQRFDDYEDDVTNIAFSFDDRYLITTDDDGFITVYSASGSGYKAGQKIKMAYSYIYGLDYHPSRHEFVAGNSNGMVRFREGKNGFARTDSIKEGLDIRNDISYSPAGEYLTVTHYRQVRIFETTSSPMTEIDGIYRHTENTLGSRFSNDGLFMATFAVDSTLVIWDISPVKPSRRSEISSWVNDNLTPSQRRTLTWNVVDEIYSRVDKGMVEPRDEFETTAEWNKRRLALEDWTISLIQRQVESKYGVEAGADGTVSIPIQEVIGYNADKQIYKIVFLETEAGVEIPVEQARKLRERSSRASVTAVKRREQGQVSYSYTDFRLEMPGEGRTFPVTPVENPFMRSADRAGMESPESRPEPRQVALSANSSSDRITHALLFATNIYDSFSELVNPVPDARTIAAELEQSYGVVCEVVVNPTLRQTAEKLREYATRSYSEGENLVVFFAGHGIYDEVFREGYVISSDSRADDISKTSYLSHSNLRTMVNNIGCNHILLVMDVCFGGTFDPYLAASAHRGALEMYADIPREEFIERKMRYRTRLYLTSGGKEYVPDGRPGYHSPFARRFLEALRMYGGEDGILTTGEIMQYVEKVEPQPRFGEFGDNEPGSDFILISK